MAKTGHYYPAGKRVPAGGQRTACYICGQGGAADMGSLWIDKNCKTFGAVPGSDKRGYYFDAPVAHL